MKVLLLAGERSGLIYADRLKKEFPQGTEFRGYQEFFPTERLAVMGFWPVIRSLFFFLRVASTMKRVMREWQPDVVVGIDYPGLNLKLEAYARTLGIKTAHVVCPQVWAWHRARIPRIAATVNRLLCFFPFEPELFASYVGEDFKSVFIGHPMVDVFGDEGKTVSNSIPWPEGRRRVAVLPGSRHGEIERCLPRLVDAMRILNGAMGADSVSYFIPAASSRAGEWLREGLKDSGLSNVTILPPGSSRDVLRSAEVAAVTSGTATLEAALARVPTVLVYAASAFLAWFARRVVKSIHYIGLANIIAELGHFKPPMPELLQEKFTGAAVAEKLRSWLVDGEARNSVRRDLDDAMAHLRSEGNALAIAAKEIVALVESGAGA